MHCDTAMQGFPEIACSATCKIEAFPRIHLDFMCHLVKESPSTWAHLLLHFVFHPMVMQLVP